MRGSSTAARDASNGNRVSRRGSGVRARRTPGAQICGTRARSLVPRPGGLSSSSLPRNAPNRSVSPRNPEPRRRSAPPEPETAVHHRYARPTDEADRRGTAGNHGTPPRWSTRGCSAPPKVPHAVGRSSEIAAIAFGDPLVAPPSKMRSNKILWVSRRPFTTPSDLLIRAQRMEGTHNVGRAMTRVVEGGPGPSIIDLPVPRCWRLTLSWSGRADTVDLRYGRRTASCPRRCHSAPYAGSPE